MTDASFGGGTFGATAFGGTAQTIERSATSIGQAGAATARRTLALVRSATTSGGRGRSRAQRGFRDWAIDPTSNRESVIPVSAVDLTAATLSLSFHSDSDRWREYLRAGDTTATDGLGGTTRRQRRDGGDPIRVEPPHPHRAAVDISSWVLAAAESEDRGQTTVWDIEFERPVPRGGESDTTADADADAVLAFEAGGAIAIDDRHLLKPTRTGTPTGEELTLPFLADSETLGTLAAVADRPAAVVERSVPDGESFREDTSAGRHTVELSTPEAAGIEDGDYLLVEWSASVIGGASSSLWRVEVVLA